MKKPIPTSTQRSFDEVNQDFAVIERNAKREIFLRRLFLSLLALAGCVVIWKFPFLFLWAAAIQMLVFSVPIAFGSKRLLAANLKRIGTRNPAVGRAVCVGGVAVGFFVLWVAAFFTSRQINAAFGIGGVLTGLAVVFYAFRRARAEAIKAESEISPTDSTKK